MFREACPEGRFLVRTCTITPEQERGDLNIEHRTGYTLARRCMAERDITAFVAVNDMVAYGVLDAILESGARVPEDYSLCGFDNIYPSHFSRVGLTTVEHHIAEKGRSALEMLHNRITSGPGCSITRVEVMPELVVRSSTGPAPVQRQAGGRWAGRRTKTRGGKKNLTRHLASRNADGYAASCLSGQKFAS